MKTALIKSVRRKGKRRRARKRTRKGRKRKRKRTQRGNVVLSDSGKLRDPKAKNESFKSSTSSKE